jgi:hypothetical protein
LGGLVEHDSRSVDERRQLRGAKVGLDELEPLVLRQVRPLRVDVVVGVKQSTPTTS